MKALILEKIGEPLRLREVEVPKPSSQQVLIAVEACGVCRTDLHVIHGELPNPVVPIIPGHQIVGVVEKVGDAVKNFQPGDRVGVPWLGGTCGHCEFCNKHKENLCDNAVFTGYQINGGFAEYTVANSAYCFRLPEGYTSEHVAPLLCAGLIGYRALRMTKEAKTVGLYGFGAAAHLICQILTFQNKAAYAFTRPGDCKTQAFAKKLGAVWSGDSNAQPPVRLEAAIIFAPVGSLIPQALKALSKGGIVVCAGIHMSDIPSFPYSLLWEERTIRSVANLTRKDGEEFLSLASKVPIKSEVTTYPLEEANRALNDLAQGNFQGSAVLVNSKQNPTA